MLLKYTKVCPEVTILPLPCFVGRWHLIPAIYSVSVEEIAGTLDGARRRTMHRTQLVGIVL